MELSKKILAALCAASCAIGSGLSEIPDLTGLTKDELHAVIQEAQSILFSTNLNEGVRVPQGTYIIGEDIPAGTYRIEISDGTGYYNVYDKPDGFVITAGLTGPIYDISEIGKITFESGNVLELVNSTFTFFPYTGIFH